MTLETSAGEGQPKRLVLKGTFLRQRTGKAVTFSSTPTPPKREPVRRPAHVAHMLSLAHHLQRAIDKGLVADRAAVARKLGLTRARVTQLLDMLLLAPDLQLVVLEMEAVDGVEPSSERPLRKIAHEPHWATQREQFQARMVERSRVARDPLQLVRPRIVVRLSQPKCSES